MVVPLRRRHRGKRPRLIPPRARTGILHHAMGHDPEPAQLTVPLWVGASRDRQQARLLGKGVARVRAFPLRQDGSTIALLRS